MKTPSVPQHNDDFGDENMQKRLKNMFSDQQPPSFASLREVEAMQKRIRELEAQLTQAEREKEQSSSSETKAESPSITHPLVKPESAVDQGKQTAAYLSRAALLMLSAAVLSLPLYAYLATRTHLWQLYALIGVSLIFAATSALSAWLARRGRISLSGNLLLGGLSLVVLTVPMLVSGLGLIMGLAFPLAILIAVTPTLERRAATRTLMVAVLVGLAGMLLGTFWQSFQITIPELQVAIPGIAIANAALMGFMMIRQFPSYPLRLKLVVVLVGVALVSISVVALTMNSLVSGLIRQQVGDNLSILAQHKALEIGTTIAQDKNTLETLPLNQLLQWQADEVNASRTSKDLNHLDQQWRAAADDDPLITQILNNQMASELHRFQTRFPQFVEIFITDSYGANIAATNRTSDYYQADEQWWQAAWNDGKGGTYIGQPTFDESAGIYAVDIALPFYNSRSSLIGILRATVDVTSLRDILHAGEFAQTGKLELVFPDHQALSGDTGVPPYPLDSGSAARLTSLRTAFEQFNYEGASSLVSRHLVSTNGLKDKQTLEGLGWYVVGHQDQSEALQPVSVMTRTILVLSLVLLLLTSSLAIYVGRSLTMPLTQLTSVLEQVSRGNLTAQAQISSRDEIGTLASTFNNMTAQLNSLITSMEQRVKERTHDLELAAAVGRAVSAKVNNLNMVLSEATEIIRSSFDLYYTQVYLVDSSGRSLVLRAGTGEAGTQLLHRGHHLAIASTSLNGHAASDRRPVWVGDTQQSPAFLPNPLLPLTRSELAVPLIANDRVVGVLDMQSQRPETFSEANISAFQVLAGQLAIAIENSLLFEQIEEARLAVEEQARLLTRTRWDEFLNAIDSSETIGFVFSQDEVLPLVETQVATFENTLVLPIQIAGASVGMVQLADESSRQWSADETEIVEATMSRVGQHIENLRLLAQSERYRIESEQVSRRLTREGWSSYLSTRKPLENGYVYDSNAVRPLYSSGAYKPTFVQAVVVNNEMIGELAMSDARGMSAETSQIFHAVAQQLSDHIENLRLLEQAQERTLELEEAQGFLDSVIQNLPSMLFVKDAEDLRFVRWNKTAEQLVGYPQEEMVGKNDYDFFPKDQADLFTYNDRQVLVSGQMLDIPEESLQTAHQGIRYMHTRKVPIYGADGKPKYLLGIAEDITERKKAEEVIRLAQQRAQIILESITIPMVITRLADNQLTFVNLPALEVTQFQYEEVINQAAPDFYYDPDDRKQFITELRATGLVSNMVIQLRRKKGEAFWALLSARVFDYQGQASILTTFMDITDRIRAQEAVARRAAELQTVAQVSTTTATTLEPDRLLQAVVDLTKEQFGLYHAHIYLLNESWNTLLLAAGAGEVGRAMVADHWNIPLDHPRSIVAGAAQKKKPIIANDVYRDPDSGFLSNRLLPDTRSEMAVPMIVGDKVLGVFDVQSDVADYFTEEDTNIYTTLSAQVAIALQNARLYVEQAAAVTQLRELDRLKSSFLANMSHELRTPLNSILGFTDVMLEGLDGNLTDYMDNDLHLIQKNGQHLLHLINDVLDMAKIESGRMNLHPETFKVHSILEEVASITSTLASEKNLSLFIEESSDQQIEIYADNTRLRQVMINLVNNSIKFTEKGSIRICAKPIEGARVLITVTDTGIGIPPQQLEVIFQEFTQVDTSSTRKVGGTGLGLPISRRLVEMHGGRLWAESTGLEGEGSTFFVELPVEARISEVIEKQEK